MVVHDSFIGLPLAESLSHFISFPSPLTVSLYPLSIFFSSVIASFMAAGRVWPLQPWPPFQSPSLAGSQPETEAEVQDTTACVDEHW